MVVLAVLHLPWNILLWLVAAAAAPYAVVAVVRVVIKQQLVLRYHLDRQLL
jgi:hypothetical protein